MSVRNNGDSGNNVAAATLVLNNDTTTNYSWTYLYANSSAGTVSSSRTSNANDIQGYFNSNGDNSTADTFANSDYYIPNYTSTTSKPISYSSAPETNSTTLFSNSAGASLYRGTSAISTIKLLPTYGSVFRAGSSFYLYGIKNS
jgi:hypothetical protein